VVDAVLQAAPDKLPAVLGVDLGPQGYAVVKVAKVLGRDAADPAGATLAPQVAQAWAAAETELYMEALKKRFKAEVKVAAPAAAASAPK
jgi:peptidyl-prolyl cis-trans isomerase D